MPNLASTIDGVLFDMDGTVLDSHCIWDAALDELCTKYRGFPLNDNERFLQMAWSMEEVIQNLFPDVDVEVYKVELEECFKVHCHRAKILEGAEEMVRVAQQLSGGKVAIVTNCPAYLAQHVIKAAPFLSSAFGEHFHCAFDPLVNLPEGLEGDEDILAAKEGGVIPSKPSPIMLKVAAAKLGVDPSRCIMIGDAINDVRAGLRCGAKTIGINWRPEETIEGAHINVSNIRGVTDALKAMLP